MKYEDERINQGKSSYAAYLQEAYGSKAMQVLRSSRGNTLGMQKQLREMKLENPSVFNPLGEDLPTDQATDR